MSFFIKPGSQKRAAARRPSGGGGRVSASKQQRRVNTSNNNNSMRRPPLTKQRAIDYDDEIESPESGDDDYNNRAPPPQLGDGADGDDEETIEERRLRLTKAYLEQLAADERRRRANDNDDAAESDDDKIEQSVAGRLERDALRQSGHLKLRLASSIASVEHLRLLRHKRSIIALDASKSKTIIATDKGSNAILWDLEASKRIASLSYSSNKSLPTRAMSVAFSPDSKLLAMGLQNGELRLYDGKTLELIKTLKGHRGAVSGVAFDSEGKTLFSASHDRSVRLWSVEERAYMETLFGHTEAIQALTAFPNQERCLTGGGADRTVRLWKIREESQLVYRAPPEQNNVDCVVALNAETFASGGDDGSVCLYNVRKNKPMWRQLAHESASGVPQWIGALAAVANSDLLASGAHDGFIRLWEVSKARNRLEQRLQIDCGDAAFVNALQFSGGEESGGSMPSHLLAGLGDEHRAGRWFERAKGVKCGVAVYSISASS